MMTSFLKSVTPTLLVLLYVYASMSKILSFTDFHDQLLDQGFSKNLSYTLQYAVPISEIITVILLMYSKTLFIGLQFSLLLLIVFSGYILLVLLDIWPTESCPCGGILRGMSWTEHFLFNCFFLILNLITIIIQIKERRLLAYKN